MNNEVIAKEYDIISNPDFMTQAKIQQEIKENDGYCISKVEHKSENLCPCEEFRKQNKHGFCTCGRFYKVLRAPKVCLCGSTKFKDVFLEKAKEFTLQGYIVTMPMVFVHSGDEVNEIQKEYLDEVHKAKIEDADLVYIINVDGYIGNSTRSEIQWAVKLKKKIEYLEP